MEDRLIDELDEILYVSDPETYELLYMNEPGCQMAGLKPADYAGRKCYEVLQCRDDPCPFCTNDRLERGKYYVWEHTNPHLGHHYILKDKLIDWKGKPARMELAVDITDKENVSQSLAEKLEIENAMVECIGSLLASASLDDAVDTVLATIGSFYKADRAYIFENDYAADVSNNTYEWCGFGVAPQKDTLQGLPLDNLTRWFGIFNQNRPVIIRNVEALREESPVEYQILFRQNIRSLYAVPLRIDGALVGYIGVDNPSVHLTNLSLLDSLSYFIVSEITKRRMQKRLEFMSYTDPLTGLRNRNSYADYFIGVKEESFTSLGVLVADIDGLKQINQNFGQAYGDHIVKKTGDVLWANFRGMALFRMGGDEFAVFCPDQDRESFLTRVGAVKEELAAVGVSVGYTWSNRDIQLQNLLNHAEELMYIEKQAYYKDSQATVKHYLPEALNAVRKLLDDGCFEMYLQPKAAVDTGRIIGAEALVRLRHPVYGLQSPDKFISNLERERIIKYVDLFIFEEVCRTLENRHRKKLPILPISLNFSRVTLLEANLVSTLDKLCGKYAFPRSLLEIEITESVGEMEWDTATDLLARLRQLGFGIALDDFGAKYTNMSMLIQMKFDVLKLDRSLVGGLPQSAANRTVVRHVVGMCHEMGVRCVAEGVETREQLLLLRELDCDIAQGYLFDRPLPLAAFEEKYGGPDAAETVCNQQE